MAKGKQTKQKEQMKLRSSMGKMSNVQHQHGEDGWCKVCKKPTHEENYVWDNKLKDYFLVGSDGVIQKDKRLDDRYVEDDVREFINLKKRLAGA